jgi:hypothetical protein
VEHPDKEQAGFAGKKRLTDAATDELVAPFEQRILQSFPLCRPPGGASRHFFGQDLLRQLIFFDQKFRGLGAHKDCTLLFQLKQQLMVPAPRLGQVGDDLRFAAAENNTTRRTQGNERRPFIVPFEETIVARSSNYIEMSSTAVPSALKVLATKSATLDLVNDSAH